MKTQIQTISLLNYPGIEFTQEVLKSLQRRGVKFNASYDDEPEDDGIVSKWDFNAFGALNYFVIETPENKALFEKLTGFPPKKTPRKHHELIKAWAEDDSLVIEAWDDDFEEWNICRNPWWIAEVIYRIKPVESVSEQLLKDIQQGLTTGIATCLGMLLLKEEI